MSCKHQQGAPYDSVKVICTMLAGYTQHTPIAKCALHKYCLPAFKPKQELYDRWREEFKPESDWYKVCKYCSEHCPVSQNDNSEK